jgi:hypothetical protein
MDGFQILFRALIYLDFIPWDALALFLLICLVLILIIIALTINLENGLILRSAIALPLKIGSEIVAPILFVLSGATLQRITEAYLNDSTALPHLIMTIVSLVGYFGIASLVALFRSRSIYIQYLFFEVWTSWHFWYLRVGSVIVVQFWMLVRVLKDDVG